MSQEVVFTEKDRQLAQQCKNCPVCRRARTKQRVYGHKTHEAVRQGRARPAHICTLPK